jgi:hypothetical protein
VWTKTGDMNFAVGNLILGNCGKTSNFQSLGKIYYKHGSTGENQNKYYLIRQKFQDVVISKILNSLFEF